MLRLAVKTIFIGLVTYSIISFVNFSILDKEESISLHRKNRDRNGEFDRNELRQKLQELIREDRKVDKEVNEDVTTTKHQKLPTISKAQNLLNTFDFRYIVTCEKVCNSIDSNMFLVIFVPSAPQSFQKRNLTRTTWGSVKSIGGKRVETIYVLGRTNSSEVQQDINAESRKFGDILQVDFIDSYNNLTLKTIMALKWTTQFCPQVQFIMKSDHDTYITIDNLVRYLTSLQEQKKVNLYTGFLRRNTKVFRGRKSEHLRSDKWVISYDEYPHKYYPDYCAGAGYVLSVKAAKAIVAHAHYTKLFRMEDVYIGICAEKTGVPASQGVGFRAYKYVYTRCRARYHIITHFYKPHEIQDIWKHRWDYPTDRPCPSKYYLDEYYEFGDDEVRKIELRHKTRIKIQNLTIS